MKNLLQQLKRLSPVVAAAALVMAVGCSDDDNGTNNTSGQGQVMLVMHDAPVDDFKEVWLTVESVELISENDSTDSEVLLANEIRMDFLTLDSISQILAMGEVDAGTYNKIRLHVSDPEFVRNDDSVFTEPEVHLVANGHVDLNSQGGITINPDSLTIISLDLDLDNSLQINQTGNGRYILRPQIFIEGDDDIDDDDDADAEIKLSNATIVSVGLISSHLVVSVPSSPDNLNIIVNGQTEIEDENGLPLTLAQLVVGMEVEIEGELDLLTGNIIATEIEVEDD